MIRPTYHDAPLALNKNQTLPRITPITLIYTDQKSLIRTIFKPLNPCHPWCSVVRFAFLCKAMQPLFFCLEQALHFFPQMYQRYRLGQVAGESSSQRPFAITLHRARRECDDRQRGMARILS